MVHACVLVHQNIAILAVVNTSAIVTSSESVSENAKNAINSLTRGEGLGAQAITKANTKANTKTQNHVSNASPLDGDLLLGEVGVHGGGSANGTDQLGMNEDQQELLFETYHCYRTCRNVDFESATTNKAKCDVFQETFSFQGCGSKCDKRYIRVYKECINKQHISN